MTAYTSKEKESQGRKMAFKKPDKVYTCVQCASTMPSQLMDNCVRHCILDIILSCYVRLNILYDGISKIKPADIKSIIKTTFDLLNLLSRAFGKGSFEADEHQAEKSTIHLLDVLSAHP